MCVCVYIYCNDFKYTKEYNLRTTCLLFLEILAKATRFFRRSIISPYIGRPTDASRVSFYARFSSDFLVAFSIASPTFPRNVLHK